MMILAGLLLTACKKSSEPDYFWPTEIATVTASLTASFDTLNADMATNIAIIAQTIADTSAIRTRMNDMVDHSSFVLEFSYINPQGIMQIIEPSIYYPWEGSDISGQAHIIQAFTTKQPALSKHFYAVEDFWGVVDIHPILNQGVLLGGVTALFRPETVLGRIILPIVKDKSFDMFVMEKGGVMIYDQDPDAIGQNLLTDTIFKPFPELVAAAKLFDAVKSGETSYSYFQTGTSIMVKKIAYWDTFEMFGTEWRIIWLKPE
ncbi:MAG: hypothetical protein WCO93_06595 [bacterium]